MQKTKLGITVGALGAITFFAGFFGGYLAAIVLAGYALLFEENAWLKRSVVKVFFSVTVAIINVIPDLLEFVGNIASVFNGNFSIIKVNQIVNVLVSGLNLAEKVLFLGLGVKALSQGTIVIPLIDKKVSKYID